jgi:hypothetical protein
MAEELLADFMGSLLIVAPAVIGMVFAYWLYKKAGGRIGVDVVEGFGVEGLGFKVQGAGLRAQGSGLGAQPLGV